MLQLTFSFVRRNLMFFYAIGLFASCSETDDVPTPAPSPTHFTAVYDMAMNSMPVNLSLFAEAEAMGAVTYSGMDEISGLAVSRQDAGLLWSHNDSGDMNRIFLTGHDGSFKGVFRILGSGNRDWEDMAIGEGPDPGVNYLYIADVGDNHKQWPEVYLYRFPEPDVTTADSSVQWTDVAPEWVERFPVKYPDGARDAETLLLDPWTLDLFVVSKSDFPARIYRLAYPYSDGEARTFELYGTLPVTLLTGGDISADGKQIVLKTKERTWRWTREEGESLADAFMREPQRVPYLPEPQGEAIAFTVDGSGYFTLSEKGSSSLPPIVYFYERLEE